MTYFAVLDTNVVVSSLLSKTSAPSAILDEAINGSIIPLISDEIVAEYKEVLSRDKFPFTEREINGALQSITRRGIHIKPGAVDANVPDESDVVFYAVVMEKRKDSDAYLVTGNLKHFPKEPFVVTPREMLNIIEGKNDPNPA